MSRTHAWEGRWDDYPEEVCRRCAGVGCDWCDLEGAVPEGSQIAAEDGTGEARP